MERSSVCRHGVLGLLVFHGVGILINIRVVAGGDCSLKGLPGVRIMVHHKPVVPYIFHTNASPVQGLHLALAGENMLRATWMTPTFPRQKGVSSPMCFYTAAEPGKKQTEEKLNRREHIHSTKHSEHNRARRIRRDVDFDGRINLAGSGTRVHGQSGPRRDDIAHPVHSADDHSQRIAGGLVYSDQRKAKTQGQGQRSKSHVHGLGHYVNGQVPARRDGSQRMQGRIHSRQGQTQSRHGQNHNQQIHVGGEIPSYRHRSQAFSYVPSSRDKTLGLNSVSNDKHRHIKLKHESKAESYRYTAGGFSDTLHSALINLTAIPCQGQLSSTRCTRSLAYQCGDRAAGLSHAIHVQVQDSSVPLTAGPQIAIVADLGLPSGLKTINSIAARIPDARDQSSGVSMLMHAGDIGYADFYNRSTHHNSYVWVDYMNGLQRVASRIPYMAAPGNHEAQFNFAAYLHWLPMPYAPSNSSSPFWFSFRHLGVHVLAFSTEHDFSPRSAQRRWMEEDLKRANENRARVPWVVVMGHRPLYCSSVMCHKRCHVKAARYRSHVEGLLRQQRVDVVIAGHNHQYERSFPVYQGRATQRDYVNPRAPVYIVNGAGGNPEILDPTFQRDVAWRAWYLPSMTTGFLLMTPSITRLRFDYVNSDSSNVIDSFTIVRSG
ncbi:uncharacterized protein [Littorina saxatilis]|uniref:uncharacterized protein n=1 Tax=Littorina saxatilis TaxID=31220 RepID=UPI0038B46F44